MRLANCTTAAQYFHLLRRQAALLDDRSAAAHRADAEEPAAPSAGGLAPRELAEGRFQPVIDDAEARGARRRGAPRWSLCSGKVYVDLVDAASSAPRRRTWRSAASSSSTRSRRRDLRAVLDALPERCTRSCGSRKSRRTWAPGSSCGRCSSELLGGRWPLRYVGRAAQREPVGRLGGAGTQHQPAARIVDAGVRGAAPRRARSSRESPVEAGAAAISCVERQLQQVEPDGHANIVVPEAGRVGRRGARRAVAEEGRRRASPPASRSSSSRPRRSTSRSSADRPACSASIEHQDGADVKVGEVLAVHRRSGAAAAAAAHRRGASGAQGRAGSRGQGAAGQRRPRGRPRATPTARKVGRASTTSNLEPCTAAATPAAS